MATKRVNLPTTEGFKPPRPSGTPTHRFGWPGGGGEGGGMDEAAHNVIGAPRHGFIVSAVDPGAVGAGVWWVDPTTSILQVRNGADDGWAGEVTVALGLGGAFALSDAESTIRLDENGISLDSTEGSVSFSREGDFIAGPLRVNVGFATVFLTGLPTADPVVAGQLWNDTGTVKVSAG